MKVKKEKGKGESKNFTLQTLNFKLHARHTLYATLLLVCLTGLSGCWDLVEVDRRAFATTIGIDTGNNGDTSVIIQLPLPQRMLPPSVSPGGEQGKRFSTTGITAKTANDALNILQTKTFRELVLEQNKSIIIGENFARGGVEPLLEFFIRNPKAPPQSLIFVAHRRAAAEILSFTPIQETLPGFQFISAAQSAVKYDRTYFTTVGEFMSRSFHSATDAFAPLIDLNKNEGMYIMAGLAAFNGFHLAGELDMEETQIYGLLSGLMKAGNLTLTLPDNKILSLRNVSSRAKIQAKAPSTEGGPSREGAPFFTVKVNINGTLSELARARKEIKPAVNRRLELAIQKVLEPKISKVIQKLQSYNSDIINFGEEFRIQQHNQWQKHRWKDIFPKVPFKVIVKAKIERGGALR